MTLNDLLVTLATNIGLGIKIVETVSEKENVIIEFEAPGYEALNAELLARNVDKVTINTSSTITTGMTIKVV